MLFLALVDQERSSEDQVDHVNVGNRLRQNGKLVRYLAPRTLLPLLLLLTVAFLVAFPLGMLIIGSFKTGVPGLPGPLVLTNWAQTLTSRQTLRAAISTFEIAIPRSILTVILAASAAWLLARTNVPGRRLLFGMIVVMFILPSLPLVLAWAQLGSPHGGILNDWFSVIVPGFHFINVYSYTGLIIVGAARGAVFLFLFLYPAFLGMDANLEEAARMAGANRRQTFIHIVAPVLAPALVGGFIFSIIFSLSSFELEELIGIPAGITVFTTGIYNDVYGGLNQVGPAATLSVLLLAVTFGLVLLYWKILKGKSFSAIGGKGFRLTPMDIGRWRWLAFGAFVGFFVIFGALPAGVVALEAFMKFPGILRFNILTTANWTQAFNDPIAVQSIEDTLFVSLISASIGVVMCFLVSYVSVSSKWKGRRILEMLAWLPWAIPGTVLALGILYAYVPLPIYGTIWLLVLAFVVQGLPVGTRFTSPALLQIGAELEEAARVHGASWFRTVRCVIFPLIRSSIVIAWLMLFVFAETVLDIVLMLSEPTLRLLSVQIFNDSTSAALGPAFVLSLVQSGIALVGFLIARILMGREGLVRIQGLR